MASLDRTFVHLIVVLVVNVAVGVDYDLVALGGVAPVENTHESRFVVMAGTDRRQQNRSTYADVLSFAHIIASSPFAGMFLHCRVR